MSRSIKFRNNTYLDSTGIVHNQKLLSDILSVNYMRIGKSAEPQTWTSVDSWTVINFNKTLSSSGNRLTYYDKGIKIGSGVSKVRVTAQVLFDVSGANISSHYIIMRIRKNNDGKAKAIFPLLRWGTISTSTIIDVTENDVIRADLIKNLSGSVGLYDYTQNFGGGEGCFLLVEVIE